MNEVDNSMIIFGGFADGSRTNEIAKYSFADNKWSRVEIPDGQSKPSARSGHTAVVYGGGMYIFGGKDDENNKLNELWRLDFSSY